MESNKWVPAFKKKIMHIFRNDFRNKMFFFLMTFYRTDVVNHVDGENIAIKVVKKFYYLLWILVFVFFPRKLMFIFQTERSRPLPNKLYYSKVKSWKKSSFTSLKDNPHTICHMPFNGVKFHKHVLVVCFVFYVPLEIFYSYGDVTITGKGFKILIYTLR